MLLGIDAAEIERDRPLSELGLDSLMAVEMRNWIESQIEINLPISVLMRSGGLDQLTETVCGLITGADGLRQAPAAEPEPDTITADQADSLLEELPELGDDQVTQLLSQMLRQQDNG